MANKVLDRESKTDIAYRIMSKLSKGKKEKREIDFYVLWDKIKEELEKVYTPEEMEKVEDDISFFYTNMTLDGRFVQLQDNKWSLRENVTYKEAHVEMSDFYESDSGDEDEDEVDEEEDNDVPSSFDDEDSYDDSTGSDADISHYRDERELDEDEDQ